MRREPERCLSWPAARRPVLKNPPPHSHACSHGLVCGLIESVSLTPLPQLSPDHREFSASLPVYDPPTAISYLGYLICICIALQLSTALPGWCLNRRHHPPTPSTPVIYKSIGPPTSRMIVLARPLSSCYLPYITLPTSNLTFTIALSCSIVDTTALF